TPSAGSMRRRMLASLPLSDDWEDAGEGPADYEGDEGRTAQTKLTALSVNLPGQGGNAEKEQYLDGHQQAQEAQRRIQPDGADNACANQQISTQPADCASPNLPALIRGKKPIDQQKERHTGQSQRDAAHQAGNVKQKSLPGVGGERADGGIE